MRHEPQLITQLKQQLNQLHKQRSGIRKMRALEDISREEFLQDYEEINAKIVSAQMKIQDLELTLKSYDSSNIDLSHIRETLNSWLDADAVNVPDNLIEQFVRQVTVVDDNTFYWILNFPFPPHEAYNREEHPISGSVKSLQKSHRSLEEDSNATKHRPMFSFTVTKDDARTHCHLIGMKFMGKKWTDKTIVLAI